MARSIVYEADVVSTPRRGRPPNPASPADADGYREKLVKYVPAEAVAFFAIAVQAINDSWPDLWRYAVLGAGVVIALLYPTAANRDEPTVAWFFYPLAALSFLVWAFGTSSFGGDLFDWPQGANKIVLAAAVPIIPGLDQLFVRLKKPKPTPEEPPPAHQTGPTQP